MGSPLPGPKRLRMSSSWMVTTSSLCLGLLPWSIRSLSLFLDIYLRTYPCMCVCTSSIYELDVEIHIQSKKNVDCHLFVYYNIGRLMVLESNCFHIWDFVWFLFWTEMPCQEEGYQEVPWWHLRQREGNYPWGGIGNTFCSFFWKKLLLMRLVEFCLICELIWTCFFCLFETKWRILCYYSCHNFLLVTFLPSHLRIYQCF